MEHTYVQLIANQGATFSCQITGTGSVVKGTEKGMEFQSNHL